MKTTIEKIRAIYVDIKGGKCNINEIDEVYKQLYINVPLETKIKTIRRWYNKNKVINN
jgi:hypothetical protein